MQTYLHECNIIAMVWTIFVGFERVYLLQFPNLFLDTSQFLVL